MSTCCKQTSAIWLEFVEIPLELTPIPGILDPFLVKMTTPSSLSLLDSGHAAQDDVICFVDHMMFTLFFFAECA